MNWLAHLYLSEPDPAFRLGNLLPDLLPASSLAALPDAFQRGIAQHRRIDAFTDSHPVVRQSIRRIAPGFRRFGGIICDLVYDHFLACDWDSYTSESLTAFARGIYASFDEHRESIPAEAYSRLDQMRAGDWLCSYRELAGVSRALEHVGLRFQRPVNLSAVISDLDGYYNELHSDFRDFFPELQSHVSGSQCGFRN